MNIEGAIITIDATGAQKTIARQIVGRNADDVPTLKGSQETLPDAAIDHIDSHGWNDFTDLPARRRTTTETARGHDTTRCYFHLPVPGDPAGLWLWKGLRTTGVVISACVRDRKETVETRYFISRPPTGVKRFARVVRSYWGIENTCHRAPDMTFGEDESRIRDEHLRENFAWLNRFSRSPLKRHPGNDSIADKRRGYGWNEDFMLEVLTGTAG